MEAEIPPLVRARGAVHDRRRGNNNSYNGLSFCNSKSSRHETSCSREESGRAANTRVQTVAQSRRRGSSGEREEDSCIRPISLFGRWQHTCRAHKTSGEQCDKLRQVPVGKRFRRHRSARREGRILNVALKINADTFLYFSLNNSGKCSRVRCN